MMPVKIGRMIQMGFSLIGFLIAISILAPNLLMIIFPPLNTPPELKDAGIIFTVLERIGQISCITLLIISKNYFENRPVNVWFILSALCIIAYYGLWLRYVIAGKDFTLLFEFYFVPIPMAVLPILAFGFIAIWGKSVWLGSAVVIFAIGHIANSWNTYNLMK